MHAHHHKIVVIISQLRLRLRIVQHPVSNQSLNLAINFLIHTFSLHALPYQLGAVEIIAAPQLWDVVCCCFGGLGRVRAREVTELNGAVCVYACLDRFLSSVT